MPVLRRNSASAARSAKFRLRSLAGYSSQSQESSSFAEDRLMGKRQSDGSSATRQSVETVVVLVTGELCVSRIVRIFS